LREKDLSEDDQVALVRALLPIAWRDGARVSLHGDPALAKAANADGVHLSARSDPIAARKLLGADKLIGVSIHTVTEGEAIDPRMVDYAVAGPAFETVSKPWLWPRDWPQGACRDSSCSACPHPGDWWHQCDAGG
jgi:thiamine-phosphate pyrophosphorylase